MKLKKQTIRATLLWLFLALTINMFYLNLFGSLSISDGAIFVGLILVIIGIKYIRKVEFRYSVYAIGALALALTSAYQCNHLTGQPFWYGLRPQRIYIIIWLMYFVIVALLKKGKMSIDDLFKVIRILGIVCLSLFSIQFMLGERFLFLNIQYNYRYGTIRLYADTLFINLLFFISLNESVNSNRITRKNIIEILWCVSYVLIVNKGRKMALCYFLVLLLAFLLWKKGKSKKLLVVMIAVLGISSMLTEEVIESILSLFNGKAASLNIRRSAVSYWMNIIRDNWVLGGGFVNTQYLPAVSFSGIDRNYFFVDNGFLGFLYQYGFLGAVWNVALFVQLFKDGLAIRKKNNNIIILLLLAFVITGFRGGGWISNGCSTFNIVFACCIADYYMRKSMT